MPERRFYTPHGESGRQSTVVLFLLLLGALWAFALSWVYVERDRDLEAKQTQLLQLISALSSQTFSLFRLMETGLFAAEHWISTHRAARPWEDPAFIALVKRLESTSGGILSFYVVDEEGGLYYVPNEAEGPRMNVSDRDYFLAQSQAESRGLYVGKTITSRVSGKQVIPVGFPVSNASSGVSMLVGVIDLQSIIMLHDKQRPLPSGTIAILRSDGTVLSHAPYQESLIGKNIADSLSYQQHIASSSKGIYYSQSSATDSVPQDISFEKLGSGTPHRVRDIGPRGCPGELAPQRRNGLDPGRDGIPAVAACLAQAFAPHARQCDRQGKAAPARHHGRTHRAHEPQSFPACRKAGVRALQTSCQASVRGHG